jgi:nitrate reductase NapD
MRSKDVERSPAAGLDLTQSTVDVARSAEASTLPARVASFSVAGVLVHADARAAESVAAHVSQIPGAIVHASEGGKLAITLEAEDPAEIVARITDIQRLRGVMSAALVSEQSTPLDLIDEELTDE